MQSLEPEIRIVDAACKFCGVHLSLEVSVNCPSEWVATLVPMAVCNHCAGLMRQRNDARNNIKSILGGWINGAGSRQKLDENQHAIITRRLTDKLELELYNWITAIYAWRGKPWIGSTRDLAERLLRDPENADKHMLNAR